MENLSTTLTSGDVYVITAFIVGVVGTFWMFFHSLRLFNAFVALLLLVGNFVIWILTSFPLVFVVYFVVILLGVIGRVQRERREKTTIELEQSRSPLSRIGIKRTAYNPAEEARQMGLPNVYEARAGSSIPTFDGQLIPELEELLIAGKIEEALREAEDGWRSALAKGDESTANDYRNYIERIQRGEW